jgi:hypothetical protein
MSECTMGFFTLCRKLKDYFFECYKENFITETRRVHQIGYLHFYCGINNTYLCPPYHISMNITPLYDVSLFWKPLIVISLEMNKYLNKNK